MKETSKVETYNIKGCIVYLPEKTLMTSYLDSQSKSDPKPEILSAGNRIEFKEMEEMHAAL